MTPPFRLLALALATTLAFAAAAEAEEPTSVNLTLKDHSSNPPSRPRQPASRSRSS